MNTTTKPYRTLRQFLNDNNLKPSDVVIRTSDAYYGNAKIETIRHLLDNNCYMDPNETYRESGIVYVQD